MFGNNDVHGKACEALEHDAELGAVLDEADDVWEQTAWVRQVIYMARPALAKLKMPTMSTTRLSASWSRPFVFGNNDVHGKACEALEHDEEFGVVLDALDVLRP